MVTAVHQYEAMRANLMDFIKEELGRMGLRSSHHYMNTGSGWYQQGSG
jgi:hypothetical protein